MNRILLISTEHRLAPGGTPERRYTQAELYGSHLRELRLFATNGREAMGLFVQHAPGVLITDWSMPDITGLELCERIRHECQDPRAHIILLTSNSDKEQVVQGVNAGADDYLTKPFHPGELLARVRVGLRINRLNREVQAKNLQLETMALTDSLTGLSNRRAVEAWAVKQLSAAARHRFLVWLIIADLNHFKSVNDTYAHDAGLVLKGFAEILQNNTRSSDICGRWGGEEFVLIFTHAKEEGATIAVERIRQRFGEKEFSIGGRTLRATASFGIAGSQGEESQVLGELVARADRALYSAKRKGRNRVEMARF